MVLLLVFTPPAASTLPFGSKVCAGPAARGTVIDPVLVQAPAAGSKRSTIKRAWLVLKPPTTRTSPLANNVAVWELRAEYEKLTGVQLPAVKSNSSAFVTEVLPSGVPPVTNTDPFGNRVAECLNLAALSEWVGVHVPVMGLYNSAAKVAAPPLVVPPTARTCPSGSRVAVWKYRAVIKELVGVQFPLEGSYSSAADTV